MNDRDARLSDLKQRTSYTTRRDPAAVEVAPFDKQIRMRRISSQCKELAPEHPAQERRVEVADSLAFDGSVRRNDVITRWETREFHGYAKHLEAAWYRRPLFLDVNEYLHD